ncbi:hypothetical protein KSP40_PGU021830 [Platanthera guangdongensis]|uniref:Uncharacterized protein n=1 Tax=Platanthera guangdongensis TaxID=2320717 RepID=A0ABR2LGB7_9ASPA
MCGRRASRRPHSHGFPPHHGFTSYWERVEFARVCIKEDFSKPLRRVCGSMDRLVGSSKNLNTSELLLFAFKCGCAEHKVEGCPLYPPDKATPPSPAPKRPAGAKLQTQARWLALTSPRQMIPQARARPRWMSFLQPFCPTR